MGFFSKISKPNAAVNQQNVGNFNVPNLQQNYAPQQNGVIYPSNQFYGQSAVMAPQMPGNNFMDATRRHQQEILLDKNGFSNQYQPQQNLAQQNFSNQNQQQQYPNVGAPNIPTPVVMPNSGFFNYGAQTQGQTSYQPQSDAVPPILNPGFDLSGGINTIKPQTPKPDQNNNWEDNNGNGGNLGQNNNQNPNPIAQTAAKAAAPGFIMAPILDVFNNNNNSNEQQNQYYDPANYMPQYSMQQSPDYNNYYGMGYVNNNQNQMYSQNQGYHHHQQQQFNSQGVYGYNENHNYSPTPMSDYSNINNASYEKKYKRASLIEKPMAKEIRGEKFRGIFILLVGMVGIIVTSIMLAVYYKAPDGGSYMGINKEAVMYPFPSIFFLLVSIAFFGWATTDLALLKTGVSKFVADLKAGHERIPYFVTRNYKNMVAREVYVNWIAFSTYIIGAICLGFLYFLEAQYQNAVKNETGTAIKFFFWKIGDLKSFKTDITINIIVLFAMFGFHIFNIVSTRSRKNNIAGYYNCEPISPHEIKDIKKRANRFCLIIFLVVLAIILFAIIIPWLVIRKKQGKSLNPWRMV